MDGQFEVIFLIMQGCGAAALIIQNAANFLPCGKKILQVQIVSSVLWAAHYGLMGLQNIMVMCFAGAIRNWQSAYAEPLKLKRLNIYHTISIIAFLIGSAMTFAELFPILMVVLFYFRMMARDDLLQFHFIGIICAILWTGLHFYNGAWFGVLNDSIATICAGLAFLNVYYKQRKTLAAPQAVPA